MKKAALSIIILIGFSFSGLQNALSVPVSPGQGIIFQQIDFLFPEIEQADSNWGRLTAYPDTLSAFTGISRGYLNVYTASGWVVDNLPVDVDGPNPITVYFTLGLTVAQDVTQISAYADFSLNPATTFSGGSQSFFPVGAFGWDAQGAGDEDVTAIDDPPPLALISSLDDDVSCIQSDVENVETAVNQCVPMAVANSLQFLENSIGIDVPDEHKIGLEVDGDSSLVGELGKDMLRNVTSRTEGSGVWFTPMLEGKFSYLADHNRADALEHKHQGRGYGVGHTLADGDFLDAETGIISKDQGNTVTWDFIRQEICQGADVELFYRHSTGGEAVRVVGCGKTGGKEWIMYAHDALQSDDTAGLETVKVNVEDLNNDGTLNLGSVSREIVLALSESSPNQPPDCSQAYADPQELWPPNHIYAGVAIMGVTDPEGDPVTIIIDAITQDEEVNGQGDGNTSPDAAGIGTDTASVRSERQGKGNGRVYEISFTAMDPEGAHCAGTVQVCVPHDRGRGKVCIDDGQLYDSTQAQKKKKKK